MTSLHHALNIHSMSAFTPIFKKCTLDLGFCISDADFDAKWQPNANKGTFIKGGCGTSRPFRAIPGEALFNLWQSKRDARWLYSHINYYWDAVACSAYESSDTIRRGIDDGLNARNITPKRIIDVGAGPGFTTLMLAKAFPHAEVHHFDCNTQLNDVFEWFNANHAKLSNAVHVSQPYGQYDVVVCVEFLEHIQHTNIPGVGDPMWWIDNDLQAILAPDGRLMMHSNWSAEQAGWLTLGHFLDYSFDGTIVSNMKQKAVANAFRKSMKKRGWRVDFNPSNRSKAPKLWMK